MTGQKKGEKNALTFFCAFILAVGGLTKASTDIVAGLLDTGGGEGEAVNRSALMAFILILRPAWSLYFSGCCWGSGEVEIGVEEEGFRTGEEAPCSKGEVLDV